MTNRYLEKIASLSGIVTGKAFTKGISSRPLLPSMKWDAKEKAKKFQRPMGDSEFRFKKDQLVAKARGIEGLMNSPKMKLPLAKKLTKNVSGMGDAIAGANNPREAMRALQKRQGLNMSRFQATKVPTGARTIPTLDKRVPSETAGF